MKPTVVLNTKNPSVIKLALTRIREYFDKYHHYLPYYDMIIQDISPYVRITVSPKDKTYLTQFNISTKLGLDDYVAHSDSQSNILIDPILLDNYNNENHIARLNDIREPVYILVKPATADIHTTARYLSSNKTVLDSVQDLFKSSTKCLAIKSSMGTGKTRLMEYIMVTYKPSSVLWLTHRQSLTNNLIGAFSDHGFISYLDVEGGLSNYDKVIVQLDSMYRIMETTYESLTCRTYDLIVIDEIEGMLSHLDSPHLNSKGKTASIYFHDLVAIINASKKLVVLDADIGPRTRLFIDQFKSNLLVNTTLKLSRLFKVYNDHIRFTRSITRSVTSGKKIVIVSMSAKAIDKLGVKLDKIGIKYIKYTANTDDKQKKELTKVNEVWTRYQVVMYSPTIESGVDFTALHFDRVYGIIIGGKGTCSIRSFLQMMGRARNVSSHIIECLFSGMVAKDGVPVTDARVKETSDIIQEYREHGKFNGKTVLSYNRQYEVVDRMLVIGKKSDLSVFDNIMIHNQVEKANKESNVVSTVLKNAVENTGDRITFDYVLSNNERKDRALDEERMDTLVKIDLSDHDIELLKHKLAKSELTAYEKLVLYKSEFCSMMRIESNCHMFKELLEYYETHSEIIRSAELLFGYDKIRDDAIDFLKEATYDSSTERTKVNVVKDLLSRFFSDKVEDLSFHYSKFPKIITMSCEERNEGLCRIGESEFFQNQNYYKRLFFSEKASRLSLGSTEKYQYRILTKIFTKHGLKSICKRTRKTVQRIDGKKIRTVTFAYTYQLEPFCHNIIKRMHGIPNPLDAVLRISTRK